VIHEFQVRAPEQAIGAVAGRRVFDLPAPRPSNQRALAFSSIYFIGA
jgi:hypothetical protein